MSEQTKKYFAVDIYDNCAFALYDSLDEAKEACLKGTEELHEWAVENGDLEYYQDRLAYAVYGTVLGGCTSEVRKLSDEEKHFNYEGIKYIVEFPILKNF